MILDSNEKSGFTAVELLVVLGVLLILFVISIPFFDNFQKKADLKNDTEKIINALRTAQSKTLASENLSRWGVAFATGTDPHRYILFQGSSYSSSSLEKPRSLSDNVEISEMNLNENSSEAVFNRLLGDTDQFGNIKLELKDNPSQNKIIYIENSGSVSLEPSPSPSDTNRIKDSRHIHINYSRSIDTNTEELTLTFDGGTKTKTVNFAENISGGNLYWQGEVDVGGETQTLKIKTIRLNNPDTQFCIHRDRRENNKSLDIDIDASTDPDGGTLIEYSSNGLNTNYTSIYVTDLEQQ